MHNKFKEAQTLSFSYKVKHAYNQVTGTGFSALL